MAASMRRMVAASFRAKIFRFSCFKSHFTRGYRVTSTVSPNNHGFTYTVAKKLCKREDVDKLFGLPHRNSSSSWYLPGFLLTAGIFSWKKSGKKEDEAEDDELSQLLKRAVLAEYKKEYLDADDMYHKALAIVQGREEGKEWDEKKVREARVYIYDRMANLAMSRSRLDLAETLFKEVLRGLLQGGMEQNHNAVIEISLKLSLLYAMQQRYEEAHSGYQFCMETQENKLRNTDEAELDADSIALLGMCINSYARFLIVQNRLDEAVENLKKTLNLAVKIFGEKHPQVAVLLSDVASVASMLEKYDEAKENITKAIKIAREIKSPDLPTFYCNLGMICSDRGEFKEATKWCNVALSLAKEYKDQATADEAEACLKEIQQKKSEKHAT